MLITFKSDAYENLTFFEKVARQLLLLMGHSGTVPGALKADEVAQALANLQKGIAKEGNTPSPAKNDANEDEPEIKLGTRAIPLINMLQAALKENCDIMWTQR
ncbi:MAG: DUF1840 domain-containing protein [Legionella sp.]|nr:DUF1840 domain-containing protein [Legionella sp.]